ncbi:MAG: hypothetical protein GXP54_06920, partial [Deltaproteobacteria bacterium]|nr:hypothetical protein [Deltaproteobacteria bacterium]
MVEARAECRACSDVCPRDAVDLASMTINADLCDGCRLCLVACPSGGILDASLNLRPVFRDLDRVSPGEPFRIACGLTDTDPGTMGTRCACPASVDWEALVAPLVLGASGVELSTGACGGCRFKSAMTDLFPSRMKFANALARTLGLGGSIRFADRGRDRASPDQRNETADPVSNRVVSRREMFAHWFRRGSDAAQRVKKGGGPDAGDASVASNSRDILAGLIERHAPTKKTMPGAGFAAVPEVYAESCRQCGLCSVVCPSGALSRRKEAEGWKTLLHQHRCVACGSCERACRHGAIRLEHEINPGRWRATVGTLIVNGIMPRCRFCGAEAL